MTNKLLKINKKKNKQLNKGKIKLISLLENIYFTEVVLVLLFFSKFDYKIKTLV